MDGKFLEKEVLEISAFLRVLSKCNNREVDILDMQTIITMFAEKADDLYCYIAENLTV